MNVDLARIQFASTSIYHFLFVPVTIGLGFLVAILQTMWYRGGDPEYKRLTKFFGTLLVINVAIGVVTGLVQEFEFGMNWSSYSRYVGDVFGAPLAMEGLAAFFLESTFLGPLAVRLGSTAEAHPPRDDLARGVRWQSFRPRSSWRPTRGCSIPVGYEIDPTTNRPVLNNIGAVFTNPVFVWGYAHVVLASLVTGSLVMLGVSAWHLRRNGAESPFFRTAKTALVVLVPAILLNLIVGSKLGIIETTYQPMKIAAAEAQWSTCAPCSFSAFQIEGGRYDETPKKIIAIPHLLSVLATGTWDGQVLGLNPLNEQYQQQYGPAEYIPNVFIQYWSMRVMAYLGALISLLALWGAWLLHRGKLATSKWFLLVATWAIVTPFLMNTAGWLLTENGRQPWIVQGLMLVEGRRLAIGQRDRDLDQPHLLHRALRAARCGRRHADVPVRAQGARRRRRRRARHANQRRRPLIRRRARAGAHLLGDFHGLADRLVHHHRLLLDGVLRPRGLRLRRRRAAHASSARPTSSSAVAINTIGPFWDGNEVWLIVAGARDVRRVPRLVCDVVLRAATSRSCSCSSALIIRGVSFEYRGKIETARWKTTWSGALTLGSLMLPLLLRHRARRPARTGCPSTRAASTRATSSTCSRRTASGSGITLLSLTLLHGSTFLTLRTTGIVYDRARLLATAVRARRDHHGGRVHDLDAGALGPRRHPRAAAGDPDHRGRRGRRGRSAIATTAGRSRATAIAIALTVVSIFVDLYPNVMVSSTSSDNNLTVSNAASGNYALKVMTVVAVVITPSCSPTRSGTSTCSASASRAPRSRPTNPSPTAAIQETT